MTDSDLPSSDEPPDRRRTPAGRCEITLQNPRGYPEAGARRHRGWLTPVVAALAPAATSFAVRFVSDREMRRLNRAYRHKDKTTDVLSFPDGEPAAGGQRPLGDVVISVPAARRQTAQRRHGPDRELRVLMLHGLLHCLGYDHETDDGTMEHLERRLRRRWIGGDG
jgi:probable rRNA maturation factor